MAKKSTSKVAILFATLSSDSRMTILNELSSGEKNVTYLANKVRCSQPLMSQHLKKLRDCGLIQANRVSREIYYSISDAGIFRILGLAKDMSSNKSKKAS